MSKARNHPLKARFRWFRSLNTMIAPGDVYVQMSDDAIAEALNTGLWVASAPKEARFSVSRGDSGVPIVELAGLGRPWVGTPQEAFFRLAELGEGAGSHAVEEAFASLSPRAKHSGENRFEKPTDSHESNWSRFLRGEREARK
jgi:hypothetical protein